MDRFRAASLFQPTNFVAAIELSLSRRQDGASGHLFGAIMSFPHVKVARTVAVLGFDFIMVDALHTAINPENLVAIIQTINFVSEGKTCVLVRVPSVNSDLLTHALDSGASGIVFPHIDTASEAREAVKHVRYEYSGGDRSLSPCAHVRGITDNAPPGWTSETIADRNIAVICQIESARAVENVTSIASTPGVNALMLGSGDLRVSMGLPARTPAGIKEDPRFYAAVSRMIEAAEKAHKGLMIVAFKTEPKSTDWLRSFNLIITSADLASVVKCQKEDLARAKATLGSCLAGIEGPDGSNSSGNSWKGHQLCVEDENGPDPALASLKELACPERREESVNGHFASMSLKTARVHP